MAKKKKKAKLKSLEQLEEKYFGNIKTKKRQEYEAQINKVLRDFEEDNKLAIEFQKHLDRNFGI